MPSVAPVLVVDVVVIAPLCGGDDLTLAELHNDCWLMGEARQGSHDLEAAVRAQTAPLIRTVLRASLAVLAATSFLAWLQRHERNVSWWTYAVGVAVTMVAMALHRSGRAKEAGVLLSIGFFGLAAAGVILLGGPSSPTTFLLVPVVLTAALFWSWRAAALLALVSAGLVVASAGLASALGLPTPPLMSPTARAWLFVGSLAMTTVLTGAAMRALRDAVADEHRRARELLALFRENPDAIVVLDDTGILREINPAALAVGGLPEREVVGRHFASVPVFSASDAALAIRRFSALLRGAKRTFALRLSRADGSVFWGDARARVIVGDDGTKRVQVTVRDVTRSRMAEQRRVELEGHLLKLQRFETIGRLSGAVAHDVNNLLSIVALVASSLRNRLGPETRELADELCDSAVRAAKLNRRLLLLGRHDVVKREPVDINLVIDGMRRLLDRLAGESLELIVRLDPGRCIVRADAAQLEQLIINLVTNARDAMPKEGRLTIETQRSTTPTSDGRTGESVVVRVSDTGVGMDPATQRHMFEPFFTTKGSAGTGLGLAAVRDIVNACGGGIRVESQPGLGTRFEVVLPALTVSGYAASDVSDAGE